MNKYKEAFDELKEVLYLPDKYLEKRLNILQELVEKATPKRPKTYCDDYSYFDCPSCGMTIGFMNEREEHHYCLNCGQALSWSESEEE